MAECKCKDLLTHIRAQYYVLTVFNGQKLAIDSKVLFVNTLVSNSLCKKIQKINSGHKYILKNHKCQVQFKEKSTQLSWQFCQKSASYYTFYFPWSPSMVGRILSGPQKIPINRPTSTFVLLFSKTPI